MKYESHTAYDLKVMDMVTVFVTDRHVKYESPTANGSKVMDKVKDFVTEGQIYGRTNEI